jgi:hypothetical protein
VPVRNTHEVAQARLIRFGPGDEDRQPAIVVSQVIDVEGDELAAS